MRPVMEKTAADVIADEVLHLEYLLWKSRTGPAASRYKARDLAQRQTRLDALRWALAVTLAPTGPQVGDQEEMDSFLEERSKSRANSGMTWGFLTHFADWRYRA